MKRVLRTAWFCARLGAALAVFARIIRGANRPAPLAPTPAPDGLRVSIVIPARNEALRIRGVLAPLQGIGHEVIVVDDESDDDTAAIATGYGAKVIAGTPRPEGWAGKPWALQQGIEAASGDWVVCLDADTRPDPGLIGALIGAAAGTDFCSAGGSFIVETPGEQWLHPSMLASLVYRFGPPGRPMRPSRVQANGQCMVLDRERFLARGGFAPAAGSLIEDVAIARSIAHDGGTVAFVDASALLEVKMHESLGEVWRHWGRSIAVADDASWGWRIADLAVLWLAFALPLPRLLARRADALDLALLAARGILLVGTARIYRPRGWAYWASPLADGAVAWRCTQTTFRPERTWRGRTYD